MDFLMTYGWGLLVVLVVIGALFYIGVFDFDVLLPERCDFHFFLTCRDYVVTDEVLTSGVGQPSQEVSGLQLVLLNGDSRNMLVRRITAYSEAFNPIDSAAGNHNCSWVNPASSGIYLFRNGAELPFSLTNSTEALGSNAADREDGCPFYDTGKKRNRYDIVFEYNLEEVPNVNYVSRVEGRLLASPGGGALLVPVPHPVCRSPPLSVSVCGRTIQVRQEILSQLSGSQPGITCDQVTSCQLRSIQTLDLQSKHIAMLKVGDFDDLTSLQTLYLTHNPLTGLPNGIFHDLTNLQSILFRNNSLTSLSSDLFDNNRKLQSLYLDADSLTSLPPNLFDSTLELRTLSLNADSLTSLPPNLFDSTLELRYLYLNADSLTSLPPNLFDSTLELRTLLLNADSLTSLPPDVLDPLVSLDFFLIRSDSVTSLPPGLFDNNRELKRLSLWVDSLTSLPPHVFDTLDRLESLSLWSKLGSLDTDVFDDLSALNSLSINDYHFSSFSHEFFANLNNLQYFGISSSSMSVSSLSIVLDHNPNIRWLRFQHTFSFSLARDVFDNTPELSDLTLASGTSVSFSSDEVFYDLPKLDYVTFYGDGSVSLPSGIFARNDDLHTLLAISRKDIGSRFSFPSDVFQGLDRLNFTGFVNFSLNPLPSGVFDTTPGLRVLVLRNAGLNSLDRNVFDHLDNLEILDLSYNNLNSLPPNIFENLPNLKRLNTNNNGFACIPRDTFGSLDVSMTYMSPDLCP